jgi:hypothetical protein
VRPVAAAALVLALGAAAAARGQAPAPQFADWTAVGGNVAAGKLFGQDVVLSGTRVSEPPASIVDGTATDFSDPARFTPALPSGDRLDIAGTFNPPTATYTVSFAAAVTDPVFDFNSLASTVTFPAPVTKVSGDQTLSVSGDTVTGQASGSSGGFTDSNGTIRLPGSFRQVTFTVVPNFVSTQPDGIELQVGAAGLTPATPTPTPTATPVSTATPAPSPQAGVRVVTAPAGGTVTVKLPGDAGFTPLTAAAALPVGSVVDARNGSLTVQTTSGTATVAAGIFTIRQAAQRNATASLVLQTPPGQAQACAHVRKGVVRQLRVVTKGVIRTVAAKGVVTGRNASWTVADRCDGTLTRVRRGRVAVTARHRTRTVRAGHSLLIRARLFRARQHG